MSNYQYSDGRSWLQKARADWLQTDPEKSIKRTKEISKVDSDRFKKIRNRIEEHQAKLNSDELNGDKS